MFLHNVKYNLKSLLKNKGLIFWSFFFPIIMATLFNMAFGNWEEAEKFNPIKIAIVNNEDYKKNQIAKNTFEKISKNDENQIFEIEYTSKNEAIKLLESKKIEGFIEYKENTPKITIKSNSVSSTIIKSVVDEINTYQTVFNDLSKNYNIEEIVAKIENNNIKTKDISLNNLDIVSIEYYSLIAMTCLYGGFIAMTAISNSLASASKKGKRVEISPIKKSTAILSSLVASFIVQMVGICLLLIYFKIIGINLHTNIIQLMIITTLGVLSGIALGLIISVMINKSEGTKLGIIIAISMAASVLAGMTGVSLKYVIDSNIPILNKINPAAMITDGLYAIYYNNNNRFMTNVTSLVIFIVTLTIISIINLRRKKYDNI